MLKFFVCFLKSTSPDTFKAKKYKINGAFNGSS